MKKSKKRSRGKNKKGGIKHDQEKVPLDLIPYEFIEEVGKVLAFGAKKYKRANWAKGINWSRLIAATERHLGEFKSCRDKDKETDLLHISHAACNLAFLIWHYYHRPDLDDRWMKDFV